MYSLLGVLISYPDIGPVPPGNGFRFTCYRLKHSELKSEQRNIKFRFALNNSPLSSYKISLDNLLRERRSNNQRLDALILVIYRVA